MVKNVGNSKCSFPIAMLAVAMGLGGELFVHFPALGFLAMLDFASYFIGFPIIAMNWVEMGKWMRRSLLWSFAWTFAAMVANLLHFTTPWYWYKCVALASSSWAIIAVAYLVLKKYPIAFLWYLVGAGLGGWIALYYFRPGFYEALALKDNYVAGETEFLVAKQIYPYVAKGIFLGLVLPVFYFWKKIPVFMALIFAFVAGVWLLFHGGSRSGFGIFVAAACIGMFTVYGRKMYLRLVRRPIHLIVLGGLAFGIIFGGYKYLATSGRLGAQEARKYETEFGEEGYGVVNGRAGFNVAIHAACRSGGVGLGGHLRCHSVMANSLACEGIVGFLFWVYFYLQVLWLVRNRILYLGRYSAFVSVLMLSACWAVFGSPFGTRHKFFVLMAFVALCRDDRMYGVGSLFDVGRGMRWLQGHPKDARIHDVDERRHGQ